MRIMFAGLHLTPLVGDHPQKTQNRSTASSNIVQWAVPPHSPPWQGMDRQTETDALRGRNAMG